MTTTNNAPAAKTRKPRATKAKAAAPNVAAFAEVLRAYDSADALASGKAQEFSDAKQARESQLIAFVDKYRAVFGQDVKSFAAIRNGQGKDKGEYCEAFRAQVAAFRLDDTERATMADPAQRWTRTNSESGKREFGPAWALEKKLTNWIGRLLSDALPILAGEVQLVVDADGNKAKAERAPRTTKPKADQYIGKLGDVVKALRKDKDSGKPELSGHDAIIKDLEAIIKAMTTAWK